MQYSGSFGTVFAYLFPDCNSYLYSFLGCASCKGPLLSPTSIAIFWLDFCSQGSNFGRASVAKDIFSANFDLIPPLFRSEWQDFGQIWPIACKIASKVVNLVTFPIVKGLILTHFPLPSVWFWLSVSIAKGMVATTLAAHPRQNSSEYPRPPTPTTTTPGHIHIQGIWQSCWKKAAILKIAYVFQIIKSTLYLIKFHMT